MVTVRHMYEKPATETYVHAHMNLYMYYVLLAGWKEFSQLRS